MNAARRKRHCASGRRSAVLRELVCYDERRRHGCARRQVERPDEAPEAVANPTSAAVLMFESKQQA
jgi:hypothetical protein